MMPATSSLGTQKAAKLGEEAEERTHWEVGDTGGKLRKK